MVYHWKSQPENQSRVLSVQHPADKPYLITGYEMYAIGSQDGAFPRRGAHVPHEMWGIWAPPIKVMDGFYLYAEENPITRAERFEMLPFGCNLIYKLTDTLTMERMQWIPQREKALVLELRFRNEGQVECVNRMKLKVISNLMPTWLSERISVTDGQDIFRFEKTGDGTVSAETENRMFFLDKENPWVLCVGASEPLWSAGEEECNYAEENITCGVAGFKVSVPANGEKTVTIIFAAAEEGREEAAAVLDRVRENKQELLLEKIRTYETLDSKAILSYGAEPTLEEMYRWTRYINDWVIREVKAVGKGLVAGYPEFPWWFGNDTNYIVPALLMQGNYEICKETLRLVRKKSEEVNGNGRVVHEISNNGVVYYEGMSTETPQFADTVWMIYTFSADRAFLEEMYDFCVQGMAYMESISVDGLPEGYGISEIAGLDCWCCDVALLMIRGYEILAKMSEALEKKEAASVYAAKQEKLWEIFHKEFFMPELGFYGDMVATREDVMERAETWKYTIHSFPIQEEDKILSESSCKQDKGPENGEEKERLRERMQQIIEKAEKLPHGSRQPYYLFGLEHSRIALEFAYLDAERGAALLQAMSRQKEQDRVRIESVMPIGLGRDMAGLGNIHCPEQILDKLKEVAEGFSLGMPGATNEIYPENGCFVQGWNSFATMWPYFNSLFGIKPEAHKKKIILKPCLCDAMKGMELHNVLIGGESFSFRYNGGNEIQIAVPDETWEIALAHDRQQYHLIGLQCS